MTLKTPSFWYRMDDEAQGIREALLTPLSHVYEFSYKWHQSSKEAFQSRLPVLCIGNIVAGGTGKTPTAKAILRLIKARGIAKNPCFMIRGYGGAELGPLMADPDVHTAWDVGDEALVLAYDAPTVVGGDRAAGAMLAEREGFDLILMDDGLQNPGLVKDLKFVVVNGEMGFGNRKLMPAGPLRQPLQEGLDHADGFILIGDDERGSLDLLPPNKPVLRARLSPSGAEHIDKSMEYLAFAGLGYPEKFFRFLREEAGLKLKGTQIFGDHHPYDQDDLKALHQRAQQAGAALITTKKDAMRLPKIEGIDVHVMPVEMKFEDEDALIALIEKSIR